MESYTLQQQIFKIIEEKILSGELKTGESLTELKLCEELGVSRTPIREAIRQLEAEELVRVVPNKGAIIVGVCQKDIEDIYNIRILVEGLAARWAAENITPSELERLKEMLDLQEFYTIKGDLANLEKYDYSFHCAIYEACKSKQMKRMLSNFHHFIKLAREVSFEQGSRATATLEEHRVLYQAIADKDAEQADKAMKLHITNAMHNWQKIQQ